MSRFHDPDGKRFGVPTWPWGLAPQHLRTRRQLAREGKSPGGEYEAQVLRARGGSRGPLKAHLYDANRRCRHEFRPRRSWRHCSWRGGRALRWPRNGEGWTRRRCASSSRRPAPTSPRGRSQPQIAAGKGANPMNHKKKGVDRYTALERRHRAQIVGGLRDRACPTGRSASSWVFRWLRSSRAWVRLPGCVSRG